MYIVYQLEVLQCSLLEAGLLGGELLGNHVDIDTERTLQLTTGLGLGGKGLELYVCSG